MQRLRRVLRWKRERSGLRIFERKRLRKNLPVLGLVLGVVLCSLAISQDSETESSCVSCHEDVYNEGMSNAWLHDPFVNKQCEACHSELEVEVSPEATSVSREVAEPVVLRAPDYSREHTVLFRGLNPGATYDIHITFQDVQRNRITRELGGVVPAQVRDVLLDDGTGPKISKVGAGPAKKGVFLETTVSWETDEPATSRVQYGLSPEYGQQTSEENALVKEHKVNLYELEGEKAYHFRVVSRDIFGNESFSEDFRFHTGEEGQASDGETESAGGPDDGDLVVKTIRTFLFGSDLGLKLETTTPAGVVVEYVQVEEAPIAERPVTVPIQAVETVEDCPREPSDDLVVTIQACYQNACHPAEDLGVSHPVGVGASDKTKIPDDLPTLEGGILTCVTCHFPHGGSRQYFARKEITKDICIACHEGYYLERR